MIYAFDKKTGTDNVLDEFRDVAEAADRMETSQAVVRSILAGTKSDHHGVGLVEHTDEAKKPMRYIRDPR